MMLNRSRVALPARATSLCPPTCPARPSATHRKAPSTLAPSTSVYHKQNAGRSLLAVSASGAQAEVEPPPRKVDLPYAQHKWMWRGHKINYATAGCGEPIILIHGFGLSSAHYRKTIQELSKQYKVYGIDLLGFGGSAKPPLKYCMELWADQIVDFAKEFTSGTSVTLVGNSIGSLAALMAAAQAPQGTVRGLVLLNSAGAMNNKGVLGDWRIIAALPLLYFIDFLLSIPAVAASLFKGLAKRESIRNALKGVYSNVEAVTDELVELVYGPSCDPGAREVFVSVITGPPGPSPMKVIPSISPSVPMLVLWGDEDKLTPADGPLGKYLQALPAARPATTFTFLQGVGHCLHDDKPELVHGELLPWLQKLHGADDSCKEEEEAAAAAAAAEVVTVGARQS